MSVSSKPIFEACYWLAASPAEREPALEGQSTADFVIVGAGLTGLWTALHLTRLEGSSSVIILEQGQAASGASGRNAGILAEGIDHSHSLAVAHFGKEEAARLVSLGRENVREMRRFLSANSIDCDLEETGQLMVALDPRHMEALEAGLKCAEELGVTDYRLLGGQAVREEIRSKLYLGALFNPNAAVLDPGKLVNGLKRLAKASSVRIFEGTKVLGLVKEGAGMRVVAKEGEVRARRVILATNAYSHKILPEVGSRFIPLYDYIVVSERLTPSERQTIGWRKRQGVIDARNFFNYYRLTADDRILWGTSEAQYYRGNGVDASLDHSPAHTEALIASFRRHFPLLSDLRFPYDWGGPIAATTRFTPFFGRALGGRILYGLGYTGHGLGTTHLAGKVLSEMALDRRSPLLDIALVRKKPLPYPPEPLRGWAVHAVSRALRRVDGGGEPSWLLRLLDRAGVGLSS